MYNMLGVWYKKPKWANLYIIKNIVYYESNFENVKNISGVLHKLNAYFRHFEIGAMGCCIELQVFVSRFSPSFGLLDSFPNAL